MVAKWMQVPQAADWSGDDDVVVSMMPLSVGVENAAKATDISETTLKKLVRENKIPSRKMGGRRIFIVDELREWLKELPGLELERLRGS